MLAGFLAVEFLARTLYHISFAGVSTRHKFVHTNLELYMRCLYQSSWSLLVCPHGVLMSQLFSEVPDGEAFPVLGGLWFQLTCPNSHDAPTSAFSLNSGCSDMRFEFSVPAPSWIFFFARVLCRRWWSEIWVRKWLQIIRARIFVIFEKFIAFYKPFAAKGPPAVFLLFGKWHVPINFRHVLYNLVHFHWFWCPRGPPI